MTRYQSIQFSPDGKDYILDYNEATKEKVWHRVNDQGSKWFFYPLPFLITAGNTGIERKRIIEAPDAFQHLEGMSVAAAARAIADDRDYVQMILS